jgi:hypothetical protein
MSQSDADPDVAGEPYDISRSFGLDELLDGSTETVHEHEADPDSPLGRARAAARESWAELGYVPVDPETFTVEPIPVADVELDDE